MGKLPTRVNRLAKTLGVPTPEDVIELFENDASAAATIMVEVLNTMIASINANSRSKVLSGYTAVKESVKETRIRLPQSKIDLSGKYEWVVYVKAPSDHAGANTNVFDRIDAGRPQLPYRTKPYVLFAAALRVDRATNVRRERVPFPTNARVTTEGTRIAGKNPLSADKVSASRKARGKVTAKAYPMVFSRGPLTRIPERKLYERALAIVKDRLSVKGLSQYFETFIVQREDFGVK